jgi:hypothetical protein
MEGASKMDTGTAIVIASLLPTVAGICGTAFKDWRDARRSRKAQQGTLEVKAAIEANTQLTAATKTATEKTYHEMNSMKDQLVAAEKEASLREGKAEGLIVGAEAEKIRADKAKE